MSDYANRILELVVGRMLSDSEARGIRAIVAEIERKLIDVQTVAIDRGWKLMECADEITSLKGQVLMLSESLRAERMLSNEWHAKAMSLMEKQE